MVKEAKAVYAFRPQAAVCGRVLVIAGSDSGGGAGIQADIKTVMALGGYALTAITALTAQDTCGVHGVHLVPPAFIRQQITHALADPGADAVKTGMLGTAEVIDLVCDLLEEAGLPVVLDPVMVAKGGHSLMAEAAAEVLRRRLLPLCTIVTPNLPEAEALIGGRIANLADMRDAARRLIDWGAPAVLLKGGHLESDHLVDLFVSHDAEFLFEHDRQMTRHTHGTGCTLASAIATGIAQNRPLEACIRRAVSYVQTAIATAPGLGAGHGPLNHFLVE